MLDDIKLEDFEPFDHQKQGKVKKEINQKNSTELLDFARDKMHLFGFVLTVLIKDPIILVYLLEAKCNFQIQEHELLQVMQMCLIANFYQGIKKITNMPQTKHFF